MATINERTNGRFTAMVRRSGEKLQFRTFDTRREAEEWATRIEGRILTKRDRLAAPNGASTTPTPSPSDRTCTLTLLDALDWYERRYTGSKKGAKAERNRIAQWRRQPLAGVLLDQIRTRDINEFIDDAMRPTRSNGVSDLVDRSPRRKARAPSTVRNLLTIVSQTYDKVIRRDHEGLGWLATPVANAELPKH
jgi:hypothetical protein